jgi:catechol 2,3-dioxygenase-like lactoylglutathione lyase family enzyme
MKAPHHVGITVADLDRAIDFYHGVLGLELRSEPSPCFGGGAALRQVNLAHGDTTLELLEVAGERRAHLEGGQG